MFLGLASELIVSQLSLTFTVSGLLEQVNVTRDNSDYLWYTTNVNVDSFGSFLRGGDHPKLLVQSTGHALMHLICLLTESFRVQLLEHGKTGELHTKKRSTSVPGAIKYYYLVSPWDYRLASFLFSHVNC